MKFSGDLFIYDQDNRLSAFESGNGETDKVVVFIGGLSDGYNAVPYLKPLEKMLSDKNWSLVQVQLQSFMNGYGTSSLQNDCCQLDSLVKYLKSERNKKTIVFLGHSTGSQDCYWHNKYGKFNQDVAGYILQAPISDRESLSNWLPNAQKYLDMATQLRKENRGNELMPIEVIDTPITANRFYSLAMKGGDDDVFSTDYTDDEIKTLYKDVNKPICWVYSENDECYVSKYTPVEVMERYQSLVPAIKEVHQVPKGDHSITREDSQVVFCQIVDNFITSLLE